LHAVQKDVRLRRRPLQQIDDTGLWRPPSRPHVSCEGTSTPGGARG
jgi:hypothetical protein